MRHSPPPTLNNSTIGRMDINPSLVSSPRRPVLAPRRRRQGQRIHCLCTSSFPPSPTPRPPNPPPFRRRHQPATTCSSARRAKAWPSAAPTAPIALFATDASPSAESSAPAFAAGPPPLTTPPPVQASLAVVAMVSRLLLRLDRPGGAKGGKFPSRAHTRPPPSLAPLADRQRPGCPPTGRSATPTPRTCPTTSTRPTRCRIGSRPPAPTRTSSSTTWPRTTASGPSTRRPPPPPPTPSTAASAPPTCSSSTATAAGPAAGERFAPPPP